MAANLSEDNFGEDARAFRPERFIRNDEDPQNEVGDAAWDKVLSFGEGTRSCM